MKVTTLVTSLLLLILLSSSCSKKLEVLRVDSFLGMTRLSEVEGYDRPCTDPLNCIPDEFSEPRTVKINVHLIDSPAQDANFSLEEGKSYITHVINNANERLGNNTKMNLPIGNDTEVIDPGYRYKLLATPPKKDAFYYHIDEHDYYFLNKGKKKNNYKKTVVRKYAVEEDSILNIFVISHPQDSLKSKGYKARSTGIALGTSLKISGLFSNRHRKPYRFGTLLNHEIGHVLGLAHAWTRYDGCDDTPVHPNCWDENSGPPCEGIFSNNVMDYNKSQMAYSPCQIGKIHKGFNLLNSKTRGLIYPDWCTPDESRQIIIDRAIEWKGDRDLRQDIIIVKGGRLDIHCRLSMSKGRKIVVEQGGEIHIHKHAKLHNACGDRWDGIHVITNNKDASEQVYIYDQPAILDIIGKKSKLEKVRSPMQI